MSGQSLAPDRMIAAASSSGPGRIDRVVGWCPGSCLVRSRRDEVTFSRVVLVCSVPVSDEVTFLCGGVGVVISGKIFFYYCFCWVVPTANGRGVTGICPRRAAVRRGRVRPEGTLARITYPDTSNPSFAASTELKTCEGNESDAIQEHGQARRPWRACGATDPVPQSGEPKLKRLIWSGVRRRPRAAASAKASTTYPTR